MTTSDPPQTRGVKCPRPPERSSAWTIPLLCAGIAFIACCVLIPAADDNRKLVYERERLKNDVEQLDKQLAINDQFLKSVGDDPTLLQRLAQRQMKLVRQGQSVLPLKNDSGKDAMSPYLLLAVPAPVPTPIERPIGGMLAAICREPHTRLFLMGGALIAIAAGLIFGESVPETAPIPQTFQPVTKRLAA